MFVGTHQILPVPSPQNNLTICVYPPVGNLDLGGVMGKVAAASIFSKAAVSALRTPLPAAGSSGILQYFKEKQGLEEEG